MRALLISLSLLAIGYGSIVALASYFQRRLMYFPSQEDAAGRGTGVFQPFRNGDTFLGYVRPSNVARKVVIFFHGNAGEALHRSWLHQVLNDPELILVLAEYPGYGASKGRPTEATLFERGLDVYDAVKTRWNLPIVVSGESLGSGVAISVATKRRADRLLLLAPYDSVLAVAKKAYAFLPVDLVLKDRFMSVNLAKTIDIPVLIVHGSKDTVIPISHSRQLFESFPGPNKQYSEVQGASHDLGSELLKNTALADSVRAYLNQ